MRSLFTLIIFMISAQAALAACQMPEGVEGNIVLSRELSTEFSGPSALHLRHPLDDRISVDLRASPGRSLSSMDADHLRKVLQLEVRGRIDATRRNPAEVAFHGEPDFGWTGTWLTPDTWQRYSRVWTSKGCRLTSIIQAPSKYAGSPVLHRISAAITDVAQVSMEMNGQPSLKPGTWRPSGLHSFFGLAGGVGLMVLVFGIMKMTRFHSFTYLSLYEKSLAVLVMIGPSAWMVSWSAMLIVDRASLEHIEIALLNLIALVGSVTWYLWCYRRQAMYSLGLVTTLLTVQGLYWWQGWFYDTAAAEAGLIAYAIALGVLLVTFRHARRRQSFEKNARAFVASLD